MDEQARRADAYPELVYLLSVGHREHSYGMQQDEQEKWFVGHLTTCWACRTEDLLRRLGEV